MPEGERRLAAIMFTDMVGYTALGQRNEALSLTLVDEQRKLIRPILFRLNGREVKTIGDAFLVEFPNALDAVNAAYEIQRTAKEFNVTIPEDRRIHLRIGVHLGDVVESQGDISGDAVNVASRIEPLAQDGGVCLTRQVYESTHNKFELPIVSIGLKTLKNVSEPIEVYKMEMPWQQTEAPSGSQPMNRIAVLPFRSMSPDPNDEFFAEGMTEEIISTVSGISGLEVISRTSVMGYKGAVKKVNEIGKELNVGSILEGSFRKAGNKMRVTTQLIQVAGDKHLWAQNYDRNLEDIFEVQSDIAKRVAEALRVRILSPEMERIERKPTNSTAAFTLYLKGREHWNKRGLEDLKKAAEYFELAVHEDPTFALGNVGLADCYELIGGNWHDDFEVNHAKAKVNWMKALELDPNLAEAHATKGLWEGYDLNLREAEKELKRAIELKPSYASAHQWYALILWSKAQWDSALEHIKRAVDLDPLSAVIRSNYAGHFIVKKEYRRAIEVLKEVLELDPNFASAHAQMFWAYGRLKMFEDTKREMGVWVKSVKNVYPYEELSCQAGLAVFQDDKETVRRLLPELEAHPAESYPPYLGIADFHFFLGETDKGFEWLERCYEKNRLDLLNIASDDILDGIRTDPRYLDLLKRLGLDQNA